ncbi:hypothetical protein GW17_00016570 [Ensete ventricosum]|nr:hypothetical protein GW17_00016570 [Ensete ventricosum]
MEPSARRKRSGSGHVSNPNPDPFSTDWFHACTRACSCQSGRSWAPHERLVGSTRNTSRDPSSQGSSWDLARRPRQGEGTQCGSCNDQVRLASESAEQALAGLGPCALARPWSSRHGVGARPNVGGADLTCVRSVVRPLAPPVYPAGYLCRVGHVGGPAVRGCDDLAARLAFVISFFPSREDLLEAPGEGVEDEVLHLTAGSRSP